MAFLLRWFDADADCAGRKYEMLRQKLCAYFEWQGCFHADICADETMDRVAHRLANGEKITAANPTVYFLGVARNVLREYRKQQKRYDVPADGQRLPATMPEPEKKAAGEQLRQERRLQCDRPWHRCIS